MGVDQHVDVKKQHRDRSSLSPASLVLGDRQLASSVEIDAGKRPAAPHGDQPKRRLVRRLLVSLDGLVEHPGDVGADAATLLCGASFDRFEHVLIKGNRRPLVKILGNGELTKKITIEADIFSQSALQAIKDCGGEARLAKEI